MKDTLLDMVQTILSSLDADEVNSITDTVESMQVAKIVKTVYYNILGPANLPEDYRLIQLDATPDSSKPVLMVVPEAVKDVIWIKYNCETTDNTDAAFTPMIYKPLAEFVDMMHQLDETATTTDTFNYTDDGYNVFIMYENDRAPRYWTALTDSVVLFDAIDLTVDTTLQTSKTVCYASVYPVWEMSDTFRPALDEAQYPLLLNEAKALAWAELRQTIHQKAEQTARRLWVSAQNTKYNASDPKWYDSLPNYGRK